MKQLLPALLLITSNYTQALDLIPDSRALAYVSEQAPQGKITKFVCPVKKNFSFDGIKSCNVVCKIIDQPVFDFHSVNYAFLARSKDRVALYIDVAENLGKHSNDSVASFGSDVSCMFSGMVPETIN